jgi:hypothetical protein
MPVPTMGDNRAASTLLECSNTGCGQRFQAIVSIMMRKDCPFCGSTLYAVGGEVPAKPKDSGIEGDDKGKQP